MAKQGISEDDAQIVKGMLLRGDKSHDIAAWFGVNAGRVAEIKYGLKHPAASAAPEHLLPPPGPPRFNRTPVNGVHVLTVPTPLPDAERLMSRGDLASFDEKWSRELATATHERRQTNEKLDMLIRQILELRVLLKTVDRTPPRPSRRRVDAG